MEILTFEGCTAVPGSSIKIQPQVANSLRENGLTCEEVQIVRREKVFYILWKEEKYQTRIGFNGVVDVEMVKKMVNPPAPPPEFWFRRSDNPPVTYSRLTYAAVSEGEIYNITAHKNPILTTHSAGYRAVVDVLPGQSTRTAIESTYGGSSLSFTVTEGGKIEELPIEIVVKNETGEGTSEFNYLVKPGSLHSDTMNSIATQIGEDPQLLKIQNEKGDSLGYGRSLAERPPPRKIVISKTAKKKKFDIYNIGYEHAEFISTNFSDADIARTLSCRLNISPGSVTVSSSDSSADIHKQEYHVINSLTSEEKTVKLPYKSRCRPGFMGICDDFNVDPNEWNLYFSKGLEVVSEYLRERFYYISPKTATIFIHHHETDALLTISVAIYMTTVEELLQEAELLMELPPNSTKLSNTELDVTSLATFDELTLVDISNDFLPTERPVDTNENTFFISNTCGVFTKTIIKKDLVNKNAPYKGRIQSKIATCNLLIICIPQNDGGTPFEFSLAVPTDSNAGDLRESVSSTLSTTPNPHYLRKLHKKEAPPEETVPRYDLVKLLSVGSGSLIDDKNISDILSQPDSTPIRIVAVLTETKQAD